jgi:hypothetical protein
MQAALVVARRRWWHPRLVHSAVQQQNRTLTRSAANDDGDAFSQSANSPKSRHNASLTSSLLPPSAPDTRVPLSSMSKPTPFRKDGQRGHFSSSSSNKGAAAARRAMRAPPNPGPLPQPQLDGDVWDLRFIENNYNPDRSVQLSPEVLSNPRHAVSRFMQTGLGTNPTFTTNSGYVGRQQYFRYVTFLQQLVISMGHTTLYYMKTAARFTSYSQHAGNISSTVSKSRPRRWKLLPLPSIHSLNRPRPVDLAWLPRAHSWSITFDL